MLRKLIISILSDKNVSLEKLMFLTYEVLHLTRRYTFVQYIKLIIYGKYKILVI